MYCKEREARTFQIVVTCSKKTATVISLCVCQVEEGIPKPIASGDSLATIQEKLGKFKRLQGQLADERPTVFQVEYTRRAIGIQIQFF